MGCFFVLELERQGSDSSFFFFNIYLRNLRLREARSPARGHPRVRSGRLVRQGPSSEPVPASRSFPVVQRWKRAVSRGPRKRRAPSSGPALRRDGGGTPGAAWSLDGRRHPRQSRRRPAGSAAGSESAPPPRTPGRRPVC